MPRTAGGLIALVLALAVGALAFAAQAYAGDDPTPATAALSLPAPYGCNTDDLTDDNDTARTDPAWAPILADAAHPFPNDPPVILEGRVATPSEKHPSGEGANDQAPSEVAEFDLMWSHYTHDKTFDVIPDPGYKHLLSSYVERESDGTEVTKTRTMMEVEWDNAAAMRAQWADNREWGSMPEFVWPSVGDRVWVEGRWVFDCGHAGANAGDTTANVKYETEIHPPRAVVTFRLAHAVGGSLTPLGSLFFRPPSLPVTGLQDVPMTQADMYVNGRGGGTNDVCSITDRHINAVEGLFSLGITGVDPCAHTSPFVPVNDRNYVFDIYPPGTDFDPDHKLPNGTFPVHPPTRDGSGSDVSLQWRVIDQSDQIPPVPEACAALAGLGTPCPIPAPISVAPLLCPVDASTPAPTQTESSCPPVPQHPTRLRVILPFAGTDANAFAKTILLGWDDVPDGSCPAASATPDATTPDSGATTPCAPVRTFEVRLHELDIVKNGEGRPFTDGEWHVFADVGGQWRYVSGMPFDRNGDGDNACGSWVAPDGTEQGGGGDGLTENGDEDCYRFDGQPWTVRVRDGQPIHVAIGGFKTDEADEDFCRIGPVFNFSTGQFDLGYLSCDPSLGSGLDLAFRNDVRIGTYEFDLNAPDYAAPPMPIGFVETKDEVQYGVTFTVREIDPAPTPTSDVSIGSPRYTDIAGNTFITTATPLTLTPHAALGSQDFVGLQYRFRRDGTQLPTFGNVNPGLTAPNPEALIPIHWHAPTFAPVGVPTTVNLNDFDGADGPYFLQFSAQAATPTPTGFAVTHTEPRHTTRLVLDNSAPLITITQPAAVDYPHSATLTLDYVADDGTGSGVAGVTALLDGAATLAGHGLQSGQTINLLTELSLGPHTFTVQAVDRLGNAATRSVTFTIVVTPDSIKGDVDQFRHSGAIKNDGLANSLLAKLNAAAKARARGDCTAAANIYQAFINELEAQSGKGVDSAAASIMIADAQYLITHCP